LFLTTATIGTMSIQLTAIFMKVPEGYVAFVEELPGANTQAETLDEARANLQEAVTLVLEANRAFAEESLAGAEIIREKLIVSAA
jgi:predicted RNase H-like HicB family nuclease